MDKNSLMSKSPRNFVKKKIVSSKIFKYGRKRKGSTEYPVFSIKHHPHSELAQTLPVSKDQNGNFKVKNQFKETEPMSKIQKLLRSCTQLHNLYDTVTERHSERKKKMTQRNRSQNELVLSGKGFLFEKTTKNDNSVFCYNPQSPSFELEILRDDTFKRNNAPPSPRFGEVSFGE